MKQGRVLSPLVQVLGWGSIRDGWHIQMGLIVYKSNIGRRMDEMAGAWICMWISFSAIWISQFWFFTSFHTSPIASFFCRRRLLRNYIVDHNFSLWFPALPYSKTKTLDLRHLERPARRQERLIDYSEEKTQKQAIINRCHLLRSTTVRP